MEREIFVAVTGVGLDEWAGVLANAFLVAVGHLPIPTRGLGTVFPSKIPIRALSLTHADVLHRLVFHVSHQRQQRHEEQ